MDQLRKYKVEIGIEVEQIKNTVSNFMLGATRCVCAIIWPFFEGANVRQTLSYLVNLLYYLTNKNYR